MPLNKLRIQTKQKALLAAFGTALHPLTLGHQLDAFGYPVHVRRLDIFFDFNDFLTSVFRKENA